MNDQRITVADLKSKIAAFVAERQWQPFHDPKNLAMSIAIEAAELMEQFQWVRSEQLSSHLESPHVQSAIRDEIADVMCYVLALANALNLDLSSAVLAKIEKNATKYPAEQFRGRYDKVRSEK